MRRLAFRLRDTLGAVLDPWLSAACGLCGQGVHQRHAGLCRHCRLSLPGRLASRCVRCGLRKPEAEGAARDTPCGHCLPAPSFDAVCVLADYTSPLDRLITAMKFHGLYAATGVLGLEMAIAVRRWQAACPQTPDFDLIMPVPVSAARLRERGFDQAQAIAGVLARRLRTPCAQGLQRERDTQAQSALPPAARQANLQGAFGLGRAFARRIGQARPLHVALIDDVMTTGATLQAAAQALREAGIPRITAVVAARTGAPA